MIVTLKLREPTSVDLTLCVLRVESRVRRETSEKARGRIDRNVENLSIKMKTTIKIIKLCLKRIQTTDHFTEITLMSSDSFKNILSLNYSLTIYICIYIYSHPQTDCLVVSQLFTVARHVRRLKLGPKPTQLYVRYSIIPFSQQAYHVSSGIIRLALNNSQGWICHKTTKPNWIKYKDFQCWQKDIQAVIIWNIGATQSFFSSLTIFGSVPYSTQYSCFSILKKYLINDEMLLRR